ncbi:Oidioi.mRNA.OKI2018_I69.PAR.g9606.t1.cds [Oikopleura dioica]|uniref:Oidioi.mRNA.OKI2018_I69.PAR.g9606.t1.cds n=1 Tax=Oikopleura dioica TaxID=34765 RepID=A0ABN7RMC7_OIKDI|nr:Oidioi.mRNA.OKI2018_I69.PAR.g9606.t1.cds [Oikopleura dioica]
MREKIKIISSILLLLPHSIKCNENFCKLQAAATFDSALTYCTDTLGGVLWTPAQETDFDWVEVSGQEIHTDVYLKGSDLQVKSTASLNTFGATHPLVTSTWALDTKFAQCQSLGTGASEKSIVVSKTTCALSSSSSYGYVCQSATCYTDGSGCCDTSVTTTPTDEPAFHCELSLQADSINCTDEVIGEETFTVCPIKKNYADAQSHCNQFGLRLFMPRTADDIAFMGSISSEYYLGVRANGDGSGYVYDSAVDPNGAVTADFESGAKCSTTAIDDWFTMTPNSCIVIREDGGCSENVDCSEEHHFICADDDNTRTTCAVNNLGTVSTDGPINDVIASKPAPDFSAVTQYKVAGTNTTFARNIFARYTAPQRMEKRECNGDLKPTPGSNMKFFRSVSLQFKKKPGIADFAAAPEFLLTRSLCVNKLSKAFNPKEKGDTCVIGGETVWLKENSAQRLLPTFATGELVWPQGAGEYFMPLWGFNTMDAYKNEQKRGYRPSDCDAGSTTQELKNPPGHVEPLLFRAMEMSLGKHPVHRDFGAGSYEFPMDRNIFTDVWDLPAAGVDRTTATAGCEHGDIFEPLTESDFNYLEQFEEPIWIRQSTGATYDSSNAVFISRCMDSHPPISTDFYFYVDGSQNPSCQYSTTGSESYKYLCSPNLGWGKNSKSFTYTTGHCTHGHTSVKMDQIGNQGAWDNLAWQYSAHIIEIDNNPPTFNAPCNWNIKGGCGPSYFDLQPTDGDGDGIGCRFSTLEEAGGYAREAFVFEADDNRVNRFTFDYTKGPCVLKYDPDLDVEDDMTKPRGKKQKPIAIQVEDFPAGLDYTQLMNWWQTPGVPTQIKSSMPVLLVAEIGEGAPDDSLLAEPNFDGLCAPSTASMGLNEAYLHCKNNGGSLFLPRTTEEIDFAKKFTDEIWISAIAKGPTTIQGYESPEDVSPDLNCIDIGNGIPAESDNPEKVYVSFQGDGTNFVCKPDQHESLNKKFICDHPLLDCPSLLPSPCVISTYAATYDVAAADCQNADMELAGPSTLDELMIFESFGEDLWVRQKVYGDGTSPTFFDPYATDPITDFAVLDGHCDSSVNGPATVPTTDINNQRCVSISYENSPPSGQADSCNYDNDCSSVMKKFICSKPTFTGDLKCLPGSASTVADCDAALASTSSIDLIKTSIEAGKTLFEVTSKEDKEFLDAYDGTGKKVLLNNRGTSKGEIVSSNGNILKTKGKFPLNPCASVSNSKTEGHVLYDFDSKVCEIIPYGSAVSGTFYYMVKPNEGCSALGAKCLGGAEWIFPSPESGSIVEVELNTDQDAVKVPPVKIPWRGVTTYDGRQYARLSGATFSPIPSGMTCTDEDNGVFICEWTPTQEQLTSEHSLCGQCESVFPGQYSETQCTTIRFIGEIDEPDDICEYERVNLYKDIIWTGNGPHVDPAGTYTPPVLASDWFRYNASQDLLMNPSTNIDVELQVTGDYDVSDVENMFDGDDSTWFSFEEPCAEDYRPYELTFRFIDGTVEDGNWVEDFGRVIFEKIVIKFNYEIVYLPNFDSEHPMNQHVDFKGFSHNSVKAYYNSIDSWTNVYEDVLISELLPTDDFFTFEFRPKDSAIVTNQIKLVFGNTAIKISEISLHWKECAMIPFLAGNYKVGSEILPGIDKEICALDAKPTSLSNFGYERVLSGEIILPGPYDFATDDHPYKQFNWAAIKKLSGQILSIADAQAACSIDGKQLIYPWIESQNQWWSDRINEVIDTGSVSGIYAIVGLETIYKTTTNGIFFPPGLLKPLKPGNANNGFVNFWGSKSNTAAQAAFQELSNGNAFYIDPATGDWALMDLQNDAASYSNWDTVMCVYISDVITTCKNLDDCVATTPGNSECKCKDGSDAVDPDNDASTYDLEVCPDYDACSDIGNCGSICENEYKYPYFRCGCPEAYDGVRYRLAYDGVTCIDINECTEETHKCDSTALCVNKAPSFLGMPSYSCVCPGNTPATYNSAADSYSCFTCPCGVACPKAQCFDIEDCGIDLSSVLPAVDAGCSGFKCEDVPGLMCPVGGIVGCSNTDDAVECTVLSECVFDCSFLGTGWDCIEEVCLKSSDCSFACPPEVYLVQLKRTADEQFLHDERTCENI